MEKYRKFLEYARKRSKESVGTPYEWDFDKIYPTENDKLFFISVIQSCPTIRLSIDKEHTWDELIDWFENEPNY